jgi:hypothetical protein
MTTALLVFQTPELPLPLTTLSPWLDARIGAKRDVLADLEKQTHRRFIKTPCWGAPDCRWSDSHLRGPRPP